MNETTTTLYRVQEFAQLAGVTVRALHHYDRVGLLKPTSRTGSSYRLYSESDLARLEQIVVLKFLGMPLREIRDLLSDESSLEVALRRQQKVLAEKRRNLEQAIMAIRNAEKSLQLQGRPDWKLFKRVIQEIEMQSTTDWSNRYYSDDAKAKIEEKAKQWSPELQEQVTKDWDQLFADVKASLGQDPASPKAQELAERWKTLVSGFTGGDPEVMKGLNAMYADRDNWPAEQKERVPMPPDIWGFIQKAFAAGKS